MAEVRCQLQWIYSSRIWTSSQ